MLLPLWQLRLVAVAPRHSFLSWMRLKPCLQLHEGNGQNMGSKCSSQLSCCCWCNVSGELDIWVRSSHHLFHGFLETVRSETVSQDSVIYWTVTTTYASPALLVQMSVTQVKNIVGVIFGSHYTWKNCSQQLIFSVKLLHKVLLFSTVFIVLFDNHYQ